MAPTFRQSLHSFNEGPIAYFAPFCNLVLHQIMWKCIPSEPSTPQGVGLDLLAFFLPDSQLSNRVCPLMSPQSSHAAWLQGLPPPPQVYNSYHRPQVISETEWGWEEGLLLFSLSWPLHLGVAGRWPWPQGSCEEPSRTSLWRETKASSRAWGHRADPAAEEPRVGASPLHSPSDLFFLLSKKFALLEQLLEKPLWGSFWWWCILAVGRGSHHLLPTWMYSRSRCRFHQEFEGRNSGQSLAHHSLGKSPPFSIPPLQASQLQHRNCTRVIPDKCCFICPKWLHP